MKAYARAASEDPLVSKSEEAVYAQFKRAIIKNRDVVPDMGRPPKGVDSLQMHAFATVASDNVCPPLKFIF